MDDMKNLLTFLFLLLYSGYSLAIPLPDDKAKKLHEIIKLFKNKSNKEATKQLTEHEIKLLKAINVSKDAEAYLLLGRAYFYAAMDSKAKDTFNKALKYNPKLSDAHFFTALINIYANNLDAAVASFRSAIKINSNNENYYLELGRVLEKKKDDKAALIEYKNALNINKMNFSANFNSANIYIGQGYNKKAEKYYLQAIKIKPDNLNVNYNLGQLYQNTKQHPLAIKYFSKIIQLDSSEWRALAKIIQENQALGKLVERDAAIKKMYALWRKGGVNDLLKQGFYVREQHQVDMGKVFVLEYFELKGERARKYVFKVQDPKTGKNKMDVSLGSYNSTTQISRELGDIGPNDRVYHLDGYTPDATHYTYAFYNSEPQYDVVRKLVYKVLLGKHKAVSSTARSRKK